MFCVVWARIIHAENERAKKYKQNTLLKSYKNEIKILANPGQSGYEQPGPGDQLTFISNVQVNVRHA